MQGLHHRLPPQSPSHGHHHPRGPPHATQPAQPTTPTKAYNPRHPERTLLYRTAAEHFETSLELASAGQFDGQGDHHTPPAHVEKAFRKYLECGIFAHGFARLPVRQWMLSVPKRIRYYLQRDKGALNAALRIFLRVVQQSLVAACPGAAQADPAHLQLGAVAFIHRFGSSLNTHEHFHVCVVDGVFEALPDADSVNAPSIAFRPAQIAEAAMTQMQTQLQGSVRIEAPDRAGLERLLRYCARPHSPWIDSSSAVRTWCTAVAKVTRSSCSPTSTAVN